MKKATIVTHQVCFHCGEDCKETELRINEKSFCCSGCKMVYELLNENDLCSYYSISEQPGINQKNQIRANKFSFLEDPQVFSKLIQFSDGKQTRVNFYLPQMHCSSCIWLLEHLHTINKNIVASIVDFPKKEISIVYNEGNCNLRQVAELLTSVGYEPHINLSDIDEKKIKTQDRSRIFKLGIAGFCFGNIMMLSFPEYFSSGIYYANGMKELFSTLNFLLSLPVFFYAASEFYISAYKGIKQGFLNIDAPIVLALAITFSRSVYEILSQTGAGYLDSMSGIVFFMLAGRMFQDRVYQVISFERDYKSYFPVAVSIKKEEAEVNVPVSKIKVGDRMIIRNQELIPADAILFYGKASIDYSFVTGESVPVEKSIGEIIYAGGKQMGGAIEMEVVKEVSQSYLTQLWNNEAFQQDGEKNQSFIHKLSKYFTWILFSIAALTGIYWSIVDSSKVLPAVTAILIVACPCSLLLSATFTNGNLIRIFNRNKFYVKNATIIEGLADADTIVFDKTGTITQNNTVRIVFEGEQLNQTEEQLVKSLAAQSSHPLSAAIYQHYSNSKVLSCSKFQEWSGQGTSGLINGKSIRLGSGEFILGKKQEQDLSTKVFLEIDGKPKGNFILCNTYRSGFENLIASLKGNYQLAILSGDNAAQAKYLNQILGEDAELHFHQSPEDKLNFIALLQAKSRKVIMIGDGLNDAGALRKSNVGIAVSDSTNNFSPACDALIDGSKFASIKHFIDFAKSGKKIIIGSFILSILYNVVGISFAASGSLSPMIAAILMPASSLSILLFTVGLSSISAKRKGLL